MAELFSRLSEAIVISFTSPEPNFIAARVILVVLSLMILVAFCYYLFDITIKRSTKEPLVAPSNVAVTKTNQIASLVPNNEGFADLSAQSSLYSSLLSSIDPAQRYLVNLCPLTASIGGYIGPLVAGVFDPEFYLNQALRSGVRSFVLPVSLYYDDNKTQPNWPLSGNPAIVCRNSAGKILSLNGMSIKKFCTLLVMYMSQNAGQSNEPILIYIDATPGYVPDPITDEKDYVQLTSNIANELSPIDPFRLLTVSSYGSAVGAQRQREILTQIPLEDLKQKILVFTNFDISVGTKDTYVRTIKPLLFDYVNFVYVPVTAANIGTTTAKNCFSIHLADTQGAQVNWTEQARISWIFTGQDDFTHTPDPNAIKTATSLGIQSIPIPMFFGDRAQVKDTWSQWSGYAWQVKKPDARYTKPPPIVPMNPKDALNARVDNRLQPGQTLIKV
jgi:hypothetical protein